MDVPGTPGRKTLTGTELAVRKAQFPQLAAEFDREITPWAGNRMLTPEAVGIIQGPGRKKAAKKTAKKKPPPPKTPTEKAKAKLRPVARKVRSRLKRR